MANKTFRRVLSIIMCAAMLVSVFAVSFTASATVTTDNDAGTITYSWDYAGSSGSSDVADTLSKSTNYGNAVNETNERLTHSAKGYAFYSWNNNKRSANVITTPTGYDPASLTAVTPNYSNGQGNVGAGAVVLGLATHGSGDSAKTAPVLFWLLSANYNFGADVAGQVYALGTSKRVKLSDKGIKITLKKSDGTYGNEKYGSKYSGAFDDIEDIAAADLNNLTYTYHVTVEGEAVKVYVDILYTKDGAEYSTATQELTFDLNTLNTTLGFSDITAFTPALGIGRDCMGTTVNNYSSKFYQVEAVFTQGCLHPETETIAEVPATCTESGVTAEIKCTKCGKLLSGGETIDALGHLWGEWDIITDAEQTTEGLKERTCKREGCTAKQTEIIPAKDGSKLFSWDYTDKTGASDYYDEMINNITFYNAGAASNIKYNSDGYLEATNVNSRYQAAVINTPASTDPYEFIMTSPNNANSNNYGTGAAVIGMVSRSGNKIPLYVYVQSGNYRDADAVLVISDKEYSYNGTDHINKTDLKLNLKNISTGEYCADTDNSRNQYKKAFNLDNDIAAANLKYLTYTYDVKVDVIKDVVTVDVTINYNNPTTNENYTTTAKTVTIDLDYLQSLQTSNQIETFEPAFGIARAYNNASQTSKVYKVWAKFAKACPHENTHEEDEIPAECLKPGREAGTYCDDCGKFISGGNVIAALGHDKETVLETVLPTCQEGYTLYKCSRCGTEYKDDITTKTGNHVKDESVAPTVVPATCTEDGYTEYTCANCGEKFRDNATPKTGHGDWTWVVVKDPSKTEDGNRRFVCGKCGYWNGTNVDIKAVNFAVESTQVVLDGSINFKITVVANTYFDQNSLKLTINGEEYTVNNGLKYDSASSDGNYARYTVTITKFAHQMTDKYDLKFEGTAEASEGASFSQVLNCTDEKTDVSVASNLKNVYDKLTDEKDAATKTLIAKLANYGAAAQKYNALANGLGEIADADLANYFLDADDANKTTAEDAYTAMTNTADGKFYDNTKDIFAQTFKASLAIGLQTKIKMIVNVSDLTLEDGQTLWVRMDGVDQKLDNNNGVYSAAFGEFAPADYAANKTITLVVKDADGADVETSGEVTYSVGAYINRMAPKRDNLKPLLNAITEYYNAATALS